MSIIVTFRLSLCSVVEADVPVLGAAALLSWVILISIVTHLVFIGDTAMIQIFEHSA